MRLPILANALASALVIALATTGALSVSVHAATPASKADVARYAQQLLQGKYKANGPGAAVLVARGDEVLYRGAIGEADTEHHQPLSADGLFRIGSITKQFAAAGLLKLVEDGKVSLDDPLSKYVKDYPNGDHILVRQLLNHTSGIKNYTELADVLKQRSLEDVTTAQLIDVFKAQPSNFAPGEGFAYSNSGYALVGRIIETASGQPWYQYLAKTFFHPLGMSHTGYGADPAIASQQVHGYSIDAGKTVPAVPINMTWPHAAGALVSSVDDLLKWNRALHEGRVLKSALYQRMITPEGKASERDVHYGYGIAHATLRGRDQLNHNGGINGFLSYLMYMPGPDVTVVILENSDGGDAAPAADVARKLAAVAIGDPYPAPNPIVVDAAALKEVEGVYRIDDSASRVLRVVDGKLTAQRTGRERLPLIPIARDRYLYAGRFDLLQIERDASGKVTGMRFFADGEGKGVVAPRTDAPLPAEPVAMALPREALLRVAGTYTGTGLTLKVFLEGEALMAQMIGQPAVKLTATSPTSFTVPELAASLEFGPAQGQAQSLTLKQSTAVLEFKRAQ